MPKMPENILYVISGDGPDKENIKQAILKNSLEKKVLMLGYIKDKDRNILFNNCDIFVQPNIKITGDMEGFGISVIEAGACGLPVIASDLEGLKDAIKNNENGFLAESENAKEFEQKILELLSNDTYTKEFGKRARKFVIDNFSWDKIAKRYLEVIELVTK